MKSQHRPDESPLKGAWSGSRDPFFNFDTQSYPRTAEETVAKVCMQVEYIKCLAFDDRLLANGRGQGHVTRFSLNFAQIIGLSL